ncbi:MAG: YkgJ family cysteine cluster protein [Verrucomicrobia bacterium]|nr:YkgJ family cysteine cluster protein [Verrucomicrobiota bacterium]
MTTDSVAENLCLACGLCCDGALFKDVELQPGDDAARLLALGLPLSRRQTPTADRPSKFPQPCVALGADCRCRVYADRPLRCRQFECALFKAVRASQVTTEAALRTIRAARQRAANVRQLLRALGDTAEHTALSLRFRRLKRRIEAGADDATASTFAELTLALHDLNLFLRREFLPDPAD